MTLYFKKTLCVNTAMANELLRGILILEGGRACLLGEDGKKYLENEIIWDGYLTHFRGRRVLARRLAQTDYETARPIIILWPDEPMPQESFVDLYFNERLVKYPTSFLGHLAVNTNGEIFNFSHLMNENEIIRHEEYFYRPALGGFAPDPLTGTYNTDNPAKPYYDKFGRRFMRSIHVLRLTGLDTKNLALIFRRELEKIRNTKPDPRKPDAYRAFNILTRNCATIIRDGFQDAGFRAIHGIFPRDLFVNAACYFLCRAVRTGIKASIFHLAQLAVPEAAKSAMPPLLNPVNVWKNKKLKKYYKT